MLDFWKASLVEKSGVQTLRLKTDGAGSHSDLRLRCHDRGRGLLLALPTSAAQSLERKREKLTVDRLRTD